MSRPQVFVNPFSGLLPGILREMTQMSNQSPRITPRDDKPAAPPAKSGPPCARRRRRRRARRSPAQQAKPRVDADGGWSSQ